MHNLLKEEEEYLVFPLAGLNCQCAIHFLPTVSNERKCFKPFYWTALPQVNSLWKPIKPLVFQTRCAKIVIITISSSGGGVTFHTEACCTGVSPKPLFMALLAVEEQQWWGSALVSGFHGNPFSPESGAPIGSPSLVESVMGVRREMSADGWESTTMGRTLEGDHKGQAAEGPTKRGMTPR